MKRKNSVVEKLRGGILALMKSNKIQVFKGQGTIKKTNEVAVGNKKLQAKNIIIATGSVPIELPFMKFDGKAVVSSDHAIAFDKIPKKMGVIGAGAIGLELGSVWQRIGTEVTIVEVLPRLAITFDHEISKMAERTFKKQGIKFALETKVTGLKKKGSQTILTAEKKGNDLEFLADKVLVCVGRKPFTEGLGLHKVGVEINKQGQVITDSHFKTNVDSIFAIGDVTDGPMLGP